MTTNSCPNPAQLARLLDGQAPQAEQPQLVAHLESCELCQRELERVAAGGMTWDAVASQLKPSADVKPTQLVAAMAQLKAHGADSSEAPQMNHSPDLPAGFFAPPREPGHLGWLGDYDVVEEIGRGAMGIVLRAFDTRLHRVVAIKVMSPHLAGFPLARQRFKREGASAAAICHEHVVTIHAVDEQAGLPYLVMQYVAGKTLQERIDRNGPLKTTEILRIGMQAAAGLAAAHAQGLVHRDMKPANLLLENSVERVKLTDFGLARAVDDASITQTGVVTGTPQFMAPEQARGESLDGRADLFSLGCVLYTLATGRPPFRAATTLALLKRICEDEPPPIRELNAEIPDWLAAMIRKLLNKQPGDRFQSASELSDLLSQCLAHMQQPGTRPLPAAAAVLANLTPPAPSAPAAAKPDEQAPDRARRRWPLTTPWGIALLIAAATIPFLVAVVNNRMDAWFGAPNDQAPAVNTMSTATPASTEELAALDRLVGVAQKQWLMTKQRYEQGRVPVTEAVAAEIEFKQAQVQYAKAARQRDQIIALLKEIVALRQQEVDQAEQRVAAGVVVPTEVLAAEKALTEAELELRRAMQK